MYYTAGMNKEPLGKWISIIYRYSMMHANKFLKDYGINAGQLPFFMNIVKNPGITQEELSKILKIDKSTTAKAVKILCQKGYLTKQTSKEDKRVYKLFPTEKAKNIEEAIIRKAFEWDRDILLNNLNKDEKEHAYKLLSHIANNCIKYFEKGDKCE